MNVDIHVLLIGDADRREMRTVVAWLEQHTTPETLHRALSAADCLRNLRPEWQPDLIVALESHPDEYSADDVSALFAAAPISRIVCCAGTWSESAGRTRKIWPLALRVAAVSAIPRLEREWRLLSNESAEMPLPATGSREEWFAAQHPGMPNCPRNGNRVSVASPDSAYRQMLVDLLTAAGHTVTTKNDIPIDVLVWDVDPWSDHRAEDLQRRIVAAPHTTVIAVSGWVTPDLEGELLRTGVRAVLPKLGDHTLLFQTIQDVVAK